MSGGSFEDDVLSVPVTKAELAADAAETRQLVASDIEELKSQLSLDRLKDRALDAAERSVESVALRVVRRLARVPRLLAKLGRRHPVAAAGVVGAGGVLVIWRARARARREASFWDQLR